MLVPEFDGFPSNLTHDGSGRVFHVHHDVRCLAYGISDTESLRFAGAPAGWIVYVFVERQKVGVWNWARTIDELHSALTTARTALDPDAERAVPLAPGGEPAQIHPPFALTIERVLQPRAIDMAPDADR